MKAEETETIFMPMIRFNLNDSKQILNFFA